MLRSLTLGAALALLAAAPACGKKKPSPEAASRAAPEQASRDEVCASYADQAIMLAKALAGGVGSAGGLDREQQRELQAELDAELAADRQELVDECQAWPDEIIDCLRRNGALSDDCDAMIARAARERIPAMPAGPAPSWRFSLADEPDHVLLGDDGVVFASIDDRVVAVAGGAERWSAAFEDADELMLDDDGAVLVISYSEDVVALDPATGAERWRLTVPGERNVRVWARAGKELLLATSDGRFFRRPAGCRAAKCLKPAGAIPDGDLDGDTHLVVLADGGRVLTQFGQLDVYSAAMKPLVSMSGYDFWTGAAPAGDGLVAAQVGDELVILDPASCGAGEALYLPPPRGRSADEERCEACADPPDGCVVARALPSSELHRVAPVSGGGAVYAVGDGKLYAREASASLASRWEREIYAAGRPLPLDDGRVLVHCEDPSDADAEDTPLALCALAGDGQPLWRAPLGARAGMIFSVDEFHLQRRGAWLLAGYGKELVMLPQ